MALPKYYRPPPPRDMLIVEKRIIDGKPRKVDTLNGKVVRVYGNDGKIIEDRSVKFKVILPPPLEPRKVINRQEDKMKYEEDIKSPDEFTINILAKRQEVTRLEKEGKSEEASKLQDEIDKEMELNISQNDASQKTELSKTELPDGPILSIPSFKSSTSLTNLDEKILSGTGVFEQKIEDIPKIESPKVEDIPKIESPKVEDIPKIESPKVENTKLELSQELKNTIKIQDIAKKIDIPKEEPSPSPNVETPKEASEMAIPGIPNLNIGDRIANIIENKSGIQIKTDNKVKIKTPDIHQEKIENRAVNMADKTPEENKNNKEDKNMVEELLEEYKREQWAKKRDFEKNIDDMARVAVENKGQIHDISQKIESVTGKIGDVEDKIGGVEDKIGGVENKIGGLQENLQEKFGTLQERLGNVKRPVSEALGELCTGVDCIKEDVNNIKKAQDVYTDFEKKLESKLESRFNELGDRLHRLEEPTFVCDNCGDDKIRVLNSFCPNCGTPIHEWTDPETGMPVKGWSPFWKRGGRIPSQE